MDNIVKLLLDAKANPNVINRNKISPLSCVDYFSTSNSIIESLLEHGAKPIVDNNSGFTLLCHACSFNNQKVTQLLLNHGVDPNSVRYNECSLLTQACKNNYIAIIDLLLKYKVKPLVHRIDYRKTLLYRACLNGFLYVVEFFFNNDYKKKKFSSYLGDDYSVDPNWSINGETLL